MAYARLLLAQSRPQEAQVILANLERSAQHDDRQRDLITIHILQSLAERQLGREASALAYVEKALRLAAPEDYVRAFLDEAPAVAEMLVKLNHVAPQFVDKLHVPTPPHSHSPTLIEPLSDRELHVLRLLTTDLSAPEIAEELFVAVSTVRSHIKHIYGKLDAHSRYEAVERAKALGLL